MKREQGFTLIELLIVVAIISIIASIAVPSLMRAKMSGNETAALADLRQVTVSETLYSVGCGNGGYAISLVTLGVAPPGSTEPFLSPPLTSSASPIKENYTFTLAAGRGAVAVGNDCNGTATKTGYYVKAVPLSLGSSGSRSFAANASGTIWQDTSATAPTEPFGSPAIPIGG
jgi:prepilin-type N-terminal cleavage/methylation domain-containing protein